MAYSLCLCLINQQYLIIFRAKLIIPGLSTSLAVITTGGTLICCLDLFLLLLLVDMLFPGVEVLPDSDIIVIPGHTLLAAPLQVSISATKSAEDLWDTGSHQGVSNCVDPLK